MHACSLCLVKVRGCLNATPHQRPQELRRVPGALMFSIPPSTSLQPFPFSRASPASMTNLPSETRAVHTVQPIRPVVVPFSLNARCLKTKSSNQLFPWTPCHSRKSKGLRSRGGDHGRPVPRRGGPRAALLRRRRPMPPGGARRLTHSLKKKKNRYPRYNIHRHDMTTRLQLTDMVTTLPLFRCSINLPP